MFEGVMVVDAVVVAATEITFAVTIFVTVAAVELVFSFTTGRRFGVTVAMRNVLELNAIRRPCAFGRVPPAVLAVDVDATTVTIERSMIAVGAGIGEAGAMKAPSEAKRPAMPIAVFWEMVSSQESIYLIIVSKNPSVDGFYVFRLLR